MWVLLIKPGERSLATPLFGLAEYVLLQGIQVFKVLTLKQGIQFHWS